MNNIKFRFWDTISNRFESSDNYVIDSAGVVFSTNDPDFALWHEENIIAVASTGLTDNNKNDIYYGDIYRVYGYGDLVIKNIHDVMTVIEAMGEGDLGDKLGDIYNNPELAGVE